MDQPSKKGVVLDDGDMISRLPCDILIPILSHLTIKQATATSVLSRRWEKLWIFYHGDLDFKLSWAAQSKGCSNYVRLVNKVLDIFEPVAVDGLLDSFTIHCNLCPDHYGDVARWVQFALEKRKVKRLEFGSKCYPRGCGHYRDQYPLDYVIARQRNIQALKSIHFNHVNVSCEIIEHFLASCPLLENLYMIESFSKPATRLRVSGETLALKYLQIRSCPYLTTIEIISAPNLVSFVYYSRGGRNANFYVGNAPKLVEFSFGGLKYRPMIASAIYLLTSFSCIEKLKLIIYSKEPGDMKDLVELPSVKHFTMCISGRECAHVLEWTPLLDAFPYLQKFTLDMQFRREDKIDRVRTRGYDDDDDYRFPSKCMEELEFLGFGRSDDDIELVMYLLGKMMVQPEKILLLCDGGTLNHYGECERKALSIAGKLKQVIPGDINLLFREHRVPFTQV